MLTLHLAPPKSFPSSHRQATQLLYEERLLASRSGDGETEAQRSSPRAYGSQGVALRLQPGGPTPNPTLFTTTLGINAYLSQSKGRRPLIFYFAKLKKVDAYDVFVIFKSPNILSNTFSIHSKQDGNNQILFFFKVKFTSWLLFLRL